MTGPDIQILLYVYCYMLYIYIYICLEKTIFKCLKPSLFLSMALAKFFVSSYLIWKGGNITFLASRRGVCLTLVLPGLYILLVGQSFWMQWTFAVRLLQRREKQHLSNPLCNSKNITTVLRSPEISRLHFLYVINWLKIEVHIVVTFFHLWT